MSRPLETLLLTHIKDYGDCYMFREKGENYDNEPIKKTNFGNFTYPNIRKIYFDLDLRVTDEPRLHLRDAVRNSNAPRAYDYITYEVVTDEIILAKFALIQNMLSQKTRAIVALAKLQKLLDGKIEPDLLEKVTDKLYEALDGVC